MKDPDKTTTGARRCKAHNRAGERCGNPAISGGMVCRVHGGSAIQVKRRAQLRLDMLVPEALKALQKVLADPDATHADLTRASTVVLDRTGYGPSMTMEHAGANEALKERFAEMEAAYVEGE